MSSADDEILQVTNAEYLKYGVKNNEFWCTEHKKWFTANNIKKHAIAIHKEKEDWTPSIPPVIKEGTIEAPIDDESHETEESDDGNAEDQVETTTGEVLDIPKEEKYLLEMKKILDEIKSTQNKPTTEPQYIEDTVTNNLLNTASQGATKIVMNTDLFFMWRKTRYLFPPEWDFGDWIESLVLFTLSRFKIQINVFQDARSMSPELLEFSIKAKADWIEKIKNEKEGASASVAN